MKILKFTYLSFRINVLDRTNLSIAEAVLMNVGI